MSHFFQKTIWVSLILCFIWQLSTAARLSAQNCPYVIQLQIEDLTLKAGLIGAIQLPPPANTTWYLSNGTSLGTGAQIQYTFNAPGTYQLCATYEWGGQVCTACDSFTLLVNPQCVDSSLVDPNVFCPAVYDPVCGCDSVTYSNDCVAQFQHGITSWTPGACGSGCPGDCPYTIDYQLLNTGIQAAIVPAPVDAQVTWILDGTVVGNGPEWSGSVPGPGNYVLCATIALPDGTIDCTICQAIQWGILCKDPAFIDPSVGCTAVYDPVCGCDGQTYGNDCVALKMNGITSWYKGECDPGSVCSALRSVFTYAPLNSAVNTLKFEGTALFPGQATFTYEWSFGDGTFSNEQNPIHTYGAPGEYEVCLTVKAFISNTVQCSATQCKRVMAGVPAGDACFDPLFYDPLVLCPTDYDPVCGCDSVTYSNACVALYQNGITSWRKGECCNAQTCKAFFKMDILPNQTVRLSDLSIQAESWVLSFGDSTVHYGYFDSLLHSYTSPGVFEICLEISNFAGTCIDKYCVTVDFSVSTVADLFSSATCTITPNPARQFAAARVEGAMPVEAALMDGWGRIVWRQAVSESVFDIPVAGLSGGVYWVRIQTEKGLLTKKLIVSF